MSYQADDRIERKRDKEAEREASALQQPLTRFKRKQTAPAELEDLRYRLIKARTLNGLLAIEAAAKFGYANSTQLSLIESGERPTPTDWKFLRQAAEVYAVSVDWLLGLSPTMEVDGRAAREFALLRGTEGLVRGFMCQMTAALIETARATHSSEEELTRLLQDVDEMAARFGKYASHPAFEDMPGGAPVLAAVERLSTGVAPLRAKLARLKAVEAALDELKAGCAIAPERFAEFFTERDEQP